MRVQESEHFASASFVFCSRNNIIVSVLMQGTHSFLLSSIYLVVSFSSESTPSQSKQEGIVLDSLVLLLCFISI